MENNTRIMILKQDIKSELENRDLIRFCYLGIFNGKVKGSVFVSWNDISNIDEYADALDDSHSKLNVTNCFIVDDIEQIPKDTVEDKESLKNYMPLCRYEITIQSNSTHPDSSML